MSLLNEEELRQQIISGLRIAVESTVNEIHEQNEQFIEEVVYNVYSPDWYSRTGDFGNAWDTSVGSGGNGVDGLFYFDSSKIGASDMEDGQHVSVVDGSYQGERMPDLIYQSGMGCVYRPTRRDAWRALDTFLSKTMMRSIFETGLRRSGLPWKRSRGGISVQKWK